VHDHGAMCDHPIQYVGRVAVIVDEILADDLEPVDSPALGIGLQQMREMHVAQADPVAEVRQTEATARTACIRDRDHVDGGNARRMSLGVGGLGGGVCFLCCMTCR
jgi:hypothetical protein